MCGRGLSASIRTLLGSDALRFHMVLDPDIPIDWLIETAIKRIASVTAPAAYVHVPCRRITADMATTGNRCEPAVANNWARGVDGLYT